METCALCGNELGDIVVHCQDCPEYFCPTCFTTCPLTSQHEQTHRYRVQRSNKCFIREGSSFQDEMELIKQIEHSGSLNKKYSDFFVDGVIGEVTLNPKRPKITDHTEKLQDSQECKTEVSAEDQLKLGMLPYRDDFTPEAVDKAELILVQKPEDLPDDLQELVADIFHRQFHERHRKRRIIREYKLADRFMKSKDKTKTAQGLEQLCSPEFLSNFQTSVKRQDKLEKKIIKLQKLLKDGCTKYTDIEEEK